MRLAILGTRGIPARYGGFETFAEMIATSLAAFGVDVTVFCPAPSQRHDATYRGVTLKYVVSLRLRSLSETVWDVLCFWKARKGYDVVYMLGVGAGFAAWIPRLHGAAVWINPDGLEWKRKKWMWLQRMYLAAAEALSVRFATRIIADSEAIAEYLREKYEKEKKITTISYGAVIPARPPDRALITKWRLSLRSYYIVVCRLEPENHVLEIIEGFEASRSSRQLVIVGDIGKHTSYIQGLVRHQSNQVRFLGTIYDKDELSALRYYACAYVHGHSVGGTNPSLLEAMACSSLVMAHDNPFNREVLGACGLYWSTPRGVTAMINAVDELHVDADTRRKQAVEIIRCQYTWEQVTTAYADALQDLCFAGDGIVVNELHAKVLRQKQKLTGEH
ncbi:MAG: DUF1972 domain-containing protein [Terracidiphilus sp.]